MFTHEVKYFMWLRHCFAHSRGTEPIIRAPTYRNLIAPLSDKNGFMNKNIVQYLIMVKNQLIVNFDTGRKVIYNCFFLHKKWSVRQD